jgi:hypothetical protein
MGLMALMDVMSQSAAHGRTSRRWWAMAVALVFAATLALSALGVMAEESDEGVFFFFWAVGCDHCARAKPFAESLRDDYPDFEHRWYEVKEDAKGREVFKRKTEALEIDRPGVPLFVCHERYVMGYTGDDTEDDVRDMLDACLDEIE